MTSTSIILFALAFATQSYGNFVREISLSKEIQYEQTTSGAATQSPSRYYPYSFAAEVDGDTRAFTVSLSPKPKVTLPIASKFRKFYHLKPALGLGSDSDDGWNFGYVGKDSFDNWGTKTQAELDSVFPNGKYIFSVQRKLVILSLSEGTYPPAPVVKLKGGRWEDGAYRISTKKSLVIDSGVYQKYGANLNDSISLGLEDDDTGDSIFDANQVAKKLIGGPKVSISKSLSRTVPANTLEAGHTYYLDCSFSAIVSQSRVLPKCMSIAYFGSETLVKIIAE
ncbi:MAG: hypothetical protein V4640_03415 [Verrucomicrobiota bacterium]